MDKETLKRYLYIIHPEMTLLRRFNSKYKQDITSVYDNITQGVQMYRNPECLGSYYLTSDIEQDNFGMLKYIEQKYANLKLYHGSRDFPAESVPLYVIKYPALYQGINTTDDYMPLPFFEKYKTTEYCSSKDRFGIPYTTFAGDFRTHPNLTYGVYSKDFGGFIKNPAWTPLIDPKGYSFTNFAHKAIVKHGEGAILNHHLSKLQSKEEIERFEQLRGGEIYQNHKFANIYDRYYDLFKDDVSEDGGKLDERDLYSRFTANWDITNGLTPGNHSKDERLFM